MTNSYLLGPKFWKCNTPIFLFIVKRKKHICNSFKVCEQVFPTFQRALKWKDGDKRHALVLAYIDCLLLVKASVFLLKLPKVSVFLIHSLCAPHTKAENTFRRSTEDIFFIIPIIQMHTYHRCFPSTYTI